jgi:hypothetical protein
VLVSHAKPRLCPPPPVSLCSFGTTFRPSSCNVAGGLMHAVAALKHTVILNIHADTFPGAAASPTLLPCLCLQPTVAVCR